MLLLGCYIELLSWSLVIFLAKFATDGEEPGVDSSAKEANQKSKEEVQGTITL